MCLRSSRRRDPSVQSDLTSQRFTSKRERNKCAISQRRFILWLRFHAICDAANRGERLKKLDFDD